MELVLNTCLLKCRLGSCLGKTQKTCLVAVRLRSLQHCVTNDLAFQGGGLGRSDSGGSRFSGALITQPCFMGTLCPMLKRLELSDLETVFTISEFSTICELTSLKVLLISASPPIALVSSRVPPLFVEVQPCCYDMFLQSRLPLADRILMYWDEVTLGNGQRVDTFKPTTGNNMRIFK